MQIVLSISANTVLPVRVVQTAKHLNHVKRPDTNFFELLILKHNRAYVKVDPEESMCVIIQCNTLTIWDVLYTVIC